MLVNYQWDDHFLNPSRCALLNSDQWGTVSRSYRDELIKTSPLTKLLQNHPKPFAFPNGVPIEDRLNILKEKCGEDMDHFKAKKEIQMKYFKFNDLDDSKKIFSFVGRITE